MTCEHDQDSFPDVSAEREMAPRVWNGCMRRVLSVYRQMPWVQSPACHTSHACVCARYVTEGTYEQSLGFEASSLMGWCIRCLPFVAGSAVAFC